MIGHPAIAVSGGVGRVPGTTGGCGARRAPAVATPGPDILAPAEPADSLFDRVPELYALFRERLFRDDTDRIARTLWPELAPLPGTVLLEVGCGPGRYARRLAQRFVDLEAIGVDRSRRQVEGARRRATALGLPNCRFEQDDALALRRADRSGDAVVASRLFTVVRERELALAEMHRVLRPGGRCFLAEPRSTWHAALPLAALRLSARLVVRSAGQRLCRDEPARGAVVSAAEFDALVDSERWGHVKIWRDDDYHYARCEKAGGAARLPEAA